MSTQPTTQKFEKALTRLETIVEEMETGSLNLDKMIKHFEEGTSLVKLCTSKLDEVEKKIETLVQKGSELKTKPFEGSDKE